MSETERESMHGVGGWPRVSLGEVARIDRAAVSPPQIQESELYVGLENISAGGEFEGVASAGQADLKSNKFRFTGEHLLYGKLRPYLAKIAAPNFSGICSTDILPIRTGDLLDRRFLLHYLSTPAMVEHASNNAVGINLPRLSPKVLEAFSIPLPSIEEQRRIARVLDAADTLRTKRHQAIVKLNSLIQALFVDMFGDPVVNPKEWPDSSVDGALHFLTYGHRFYEDTYAESGTPVVRITDLDDNGHLHFSSMPRMDLSEEERRRYRVNAGDILFARSGATVGKVALIREGDPECIAGAYFVWMRFIEDVRPEFARCVLTSDRVKELVAIKSRQAAQQNFSGPAIRRLPMPRPPAHLQDAFVARVALIRTEVERRRDAAGRLDNLFASLQQRAFRGEL